MHMRMVRQRRAPGVQDQRHANLRTEVLRIVYDHPSVPNPFPVRRVLDEVVEVEPGLLLGKAHLRGWGGRAWPVAFFALRLDPPAV